MRPDNAVPDVQLLKRFLLGQLGREESEPIERYLEQHPEFASTLAGLVKEDTLVSSLRDSAGPPLADPPELAALMDKLSWLRPISDDTTTNGGDGGGGAGDSPLLAPPRGPDEMGWLGGYRVLKVLGADGMGMVYQAEDVQLQRPIALKVMKPEVAQNAGNRERFLREARAAAKLKSDHVVNIYQVGEERQIVYLAMEFLEGLSMDDWLKKGRQATLAQAARMGRQIALGLAAAHGCGLIHRDIKPGNIWLDSRSQGRVKLLDFGLARGDSEEVQLTQSGAIVGTPAYMAPEQARGEHVDPRCDLFSLGVVLYRLTTGRLPFRGDNTMSVLTSLALDTPPPPRQINPDIPPRMASLIERLLSKDREQRPATAKVVADELAIVEREAAQPATDEPTVRLVGAASVSAPVAFPARSRSRLGWLVAASLLLLGGVTAAIVVIIRDKHGKEVSRNVVPDGGKVVIEDDGKGKAEAKKQQAPKENVRVAAAPLAALLPGEPLSPSALVQRPAKLPGVRSWSIEKRDPWMTTAVAYRPDGQRVAVGDVDGSVRIWEPQSGRLVQVCLGVGSVQFLAWSPDGKTLAVGSWRESLHKPDFRLWGAEKGRLLRTLEPPSSRGGSAALAWSADGRTLLALHPNDGGCLLWNAADGKLLRKVAIPCQGPAAFSPDAKWLAGATADSHFALWDVETGKEVRKLDEYKLAALPALAWSPDGKRLALTAADGVRVWQATTGERIVHAKDLPQCHSICWSPDGRTFAAGRHSQGVAVVDLAAKGKLRALEDDVHSSLAWSPDGKTIARIAWGGGGGGGWVRLYDAATGKRQRALAEGEPPNAIFAWSAAGSTVALNYDGKTSLSSVDAGQVSAVLKDTIEPLAWSPDGKRLATAGQDRRTVILWEDGGQTRLALKGHLQGVSWLAWSPDGKRLASSAGGEKRVLLWDADKVEKLRELGPLPAEAAGLKWSADGRLIAFQAPERRWHFWDVEQNKLVNDPKQWQAHALAFAPDGRSALIWSPYLCQLRDLATGKEQSRLDAPYWQSPTLSPDGRLAAVPTASGVELWRGDLRRRVRTLQAGLMINEVVFSADGKLVAGRSGGRLHLWEADTGRPRGILMLGESNHGLTLTPDGHYTGDDQVERGIVMVVQKDDGTQELLEPADFEEKYGWKNEPNKVHLLQPLPPPLYPLPGQPMGPNALVREPAELPDVNSWTIETINSRGRINAAAYRHDGKWLATGGDDGAIRIWDTADGKLVCMLVGDPVWSLSWSKDGKVLAASRDRTTVLWEVEAGRLLRRLPLAGELRWSPQENILAIFNGNGILSLWDASTERMVRTFTFPKQGWAMAWSPDGKTLALGFADKTIRLWDTASGKEVRKLEGHESGYIRGLAWSPDGKRLVTTALDERNFFVWDAASGKLLGRFPMEVPWETPSTLAWTPDGKAVAVGALGLFDLDTGRRLRSFDASDNKFLAAWPADFKQIATFGERGVRLHDAVTGKWTHTLESLNLLQPIHSLAWSPDSRSLALGYQFDGDGLRLEAVTGKHGLPAPKGGFHAAAWSPDGKTFATVSGKSGGVCLWDAMTNRPVRTLDGTAPLDVWWLAWSGDGKKLAGSNASQIWVWSAETGKLLWQNEKFGGDLVWSPDGQQLATTDNAKKQAVRIWAADTGKLLHESPLTWETQAAWSPDGKTLAAGPTEQGECLLIDAASGAVRVKARTEGGLHHIRAIRWARDRKTFSTIDRGEHRRYFDAATGKQLRTLPLSLGNGNGSWSPDGQVLAWSNGFEIRLYDSECWPLGVLLPSDPFAQLAVTAAGRYRGNARVERQIRMVVQKRDGTSETLTPGEFEQKYGFKNDPAKARLTDK
jgi:WD40 repeat protein